MNKLITTVRLLVLASLVFASGCDKDTLKVPTPAETMIKTFPNTRILRSTESVNVFLVEKDGAITEYYCGGGRVSPQTTYVPLTP